MKKKNGRPELPQEEKRGHCVSVRLNPAELEKLDVIRGRMRRGEAVRLALFSRLPAAVPEINASLRSDLGRALGNLSTVAGRMRGGEFVEVEDVRKAVMNLREKLIGGAQ